MGININSLETLAQRVVNCTKAQPAFLKGVNVTELKLAPLTKDVYTFGYSGIIEKLNTVQLTELLKRTIKNDSEMSGSYATCFNLNQHKNFLLRVKTDSIPKFKINKSEYKLIPIDYPNIVKNNNNLGIPLFAVVEKNSQYASKKSFSAMEAFSDDINMWILRKSEGIVPYNDCNNSFMELTGRYPSNSKQDFNFHELRYLLNQKDKGLALNFLEACKKGEYTLKKGQNGVSMDTFFQDVDVFYKNYNNFVNNYFNQIDKIINMPQETFNKAILDIKNNYTKHSRLDFNTVNNTLIDSDKKSFNFIDLMFNPVAKDFNQCNYKNPINEFANVLTGKGFCGLNYIDYPHELLIRPEDTALLKIKVNALAEKISKACKSGKVKWGEKKFLRNFD